MLRKEVGRDRRRISPKSTMNTLLLLVLILLGMTAAAQDTHTWVSLYGGDWCDEANWHYGGDNHGIPDIGDTAVFDIDAASYDVSFGTLCSTSLGNLEINDDITMSEAQWAGLTTTEAWIGNKAHSSGTVKFIGYVTNPTVSNNLHVGAGVGASGGIDVSGGSQLNVSGISYIGDTVDSVGTVTVEGKVVIWRIGQRPVTHRSTWNAGTNCYIGYYGEGNLFVLDGAIVNCVDASIGGACDTKCGIGTALISDGSNWNIDNTLEVGMGIPPGGNIISKGYLRVKDGGTVSANYLKISSPNTVSLENGNINAYGTGVELIAGQWETIPARLTGYGTISGNVINHGYVQPGAIGDGPLTVNGDYTQDGTLMISVMGAEDGQYNKLEITGSSENSATIGGTLRVDIPADSALGSSGCQIPIITAPATIQGSFSSVIAPSGWTHSLSQPEDPDENGIYTLYLTLTYAGSSTPVDDLGWLVKGNSPSNPVQFKDSCDEIHLLMLYSRQDYHNKRGQILDINLTQSQAQNQSVYSLVDGITGVASLALNHSNGNLYITSVHSFEWPKYSEYHGMIAEYDPLLNVVKRQWPTSDKSISCLFEGADGRIYIGGGTSGIINILDLSTGLMTNLGIIDDPLGGSTTWCSGGTCTSCPTERERYIYTMGADEDYIYAVIRDNKQIPAGPKSSASCNPNGGYYLVRINQHDYSDQKYWSDSVDCGNDPNCISCSGCDGWKKGTTNNSLIIQQGKDTGSCYPSYNCSCSLYDGVLYFSCPSGHYRFENGLPVFEDGYCSYEGNEYFCESCLKNRNWEIFNVKAWDDTSNGFTITLDNVIPSQVHGSAGGPVHIHFIDSSSTRYDVEVPFSDFHTDPMKVIGLHDVGNSELLGYTFATTPYYGPVMLYDTDTQTTTIKGYPHRSLYHALYDASAERVFLSGYPTTTMEYKRYYNGISDWTWSNVAVAPEVYPNPHIYDVPCETLRHRSQALGKNGLLYVGCNRDRSTSEPNCAALRVIDPSNNLLTSYTCSTPGDFECGTYGDDPINCRDTVEFESGNSAVYETEDLISVSKEGKPDWIAMSLKSKGTLMTNGAMYFYDCTDRDTPVAPAFSDNLPLNPPLASTQVDAGKLIDLGDGTFFGMTKTEFFKVNLNCANSPFYEYRYHLPTSPTNYVAFDTTLDESLSHLVRNETDGMVYFILEYIESNSTKYGLYRFNPASTSISACNFGPGFEPVLYDIGEPGYLTFKGNDLYLYGFSSGHVKEIKDVLHVYCGIRSENPPFVPCYLCAGSAVTTATCQQ